MLLIALGLFVAGCGEDEDEPTVAAAAEDVELTQSGACGEAYFWAASENGAVAVTVSVEARDRSADEQTVIRFAVTDPGVEVKVLHGNQLHRNFCTDVIDGASEPKEAEAAAVGEGEIQLDPPGPEVSSCGTTSGTLRLQGLEAESGLTFAPIDVSSESIGCYAG